MGESLTVFCAGITPLLSPLTGSSVSSLPGVMCTSDFNFLCGEHGSPLLAQGKFSAYCRPWVWALVLSLVQLTKIFLSKNIRTVFSFCLWKQSILHWVCCIFPWKFVILLQTKESFMNFLVLSFFCILFSYFLYCLNGKLRVLLSVGIILILMEFK